MPRRTLLNLVLTGLLLGACNFPWLPSWPAPRDPKDPAPPDPATCDEAEFYELSGECRRRAQGISAGNGYTCAVLVGGSLKCWGGDSWYRLGYAPVNMDRGDNPAEVGDALPPIDLGPGLVATEVYAASDVTCAIMQGGTAKCWGYNGYGAMTGGSPSPASGILVKDAKLWSYTSPAVALSAGTGNGLVLHDDGSISRIGNAGSGYDLSGNVAVAFERASMYDDWHLCAVNDGGQVLCKGDGVTPPGKLGRDTSGEPLGGPSPYPHVDLGTGVTAESVVVGDAHACALLMDGAVKCWGLNSSGQLGVGDSNDRGLDPLAMGDALPVVPLGMPANALAAGRNHTCALLDDGNVKCWGANAAGQLGQGHTSPLGDDPGEVAAMAPVDLGTGRTADSIDAGTHTCALLDNGAVKCWGDNTLGQLGQGDTAARGDAPGELGDMLPAIDLGT